MLRALLRWWWLIALCVSLGVGAGYLLRTEQPNLYFAQATVMISQDANSPVPVGVDRNVLNAYTVQVRRTSLIQTVIDDLGLNVSVNNLLERMSVDVRYNGSLLLIGITDTDPDRAAIIANRIVDELIRQTTDRATLLDLEFINNQIRDIQNQITNLQSQYDALVEEAAGLTSAFDLSRNLEERGRIESTIRELRTLLLDLVDNAPRSQVQIFERAVPDYYPITSSGMRDLAIAGAAGGILAVLTIILFTFFDDRLQWDDGKTDTILGVRVLGPMGIIPSNKLPLYVDTMPDSVEAEALRQIRAKLALAAGGDYPQVITVLSYDSGEGKTLTSANLALETARAGLNTLLIDGDMRRSDLHEIFRLPNIQGLSDILSSREPIAPLVARTILDSGYEHLALLPSGRATADPAALLGRERFGEMIQLLRAHYDAIVIDAAPTIGGPDAVFLGEASDGVMIVVNARRTRLSALRRTLDELASGPHVRVLGIAFNRVRLQITSKYNSKYYYRQSPSLNAEKLSKDLARPGAGPLAAWRRHIIAAPDGERLYSISAAAARLGIKNRTVASWVNTGYLASERRYLRRWIRESAMNALMQQHAAQATPAISAAAIETPVVETAAPGVVNGNHAVPDRLREQRAAILNFVNRADPNDPEAQG
jgi:capsular exopolysaccharide synthesis family protein